MIPLSLRIKKETHKKIASAQDLIVEEIYKHFNNAVFHGGTAIWRCYSGKRFSEDLDFYFPKEKEKINELFSSLEKIGFKIIKKKVLDNSVYSELEYNRISVRLEATFQKVKGNIVDYEKSEGNIISVYSLTPEEFIKEKINTYLSRFKIRDLYDIFFLLKLVNSFDLLKKEIKRLTSNYKKPIDESDLKVIILEGIVPSSEEMIDYIRKKWENENI